MIKERNMKRYMPVAVTALCLAVYLCPSGNTAEIHIDWFPQTVAAGQSANLKISWKNFTVDNAYVMRVQLQDSETVPPVFVFNDLEVDKSDGQTEIALKIPFTVTSSTSAKFVAAFISKAKAWDDVLTTADTGSTVMIVSDFKFTLDEYPRLVCRGETVKVKVSWKGIKAVKGYKLIVQLENWQIQPGFAYMARIDDFGTEGESEVSIKVPKSAPDVKYCRFVAAFISKEKNWQDAYAITATPNEVDIVKHKPL